MRWLHRLLNFESRDMGQQSSDQLLLATKLAIPLVRSGLVARPRLLHTLEACVQHPLTFLAAPAGFGKTVLLSAWARQQQRTVGWVSLDSSDNDPVQFWTYGITALDTLHPGIGNTPLSFLQAKQPASIETVLAALMNALGTLQQDTVLILDDYHVIEALSIHRSMTFLLDHLPPQLHLVIASRVDPPLPLSRLRVRGQLVELRADDLRFTFDEAATFLNDSMGLHLRMDDIVALENRTEGWIAGLQLAALSMQGRKDLAGFVSAFAGSHRYILDYLTEEVLRQQPEHVRTFLLQTSILDRFNGSLCDALTGQARSQEMLEQLEQANLFLIPLDDERSWYRYHHLFADALRFRLNQADPDLPILLHQRASAWFENNDYITEAVNHALAANDFERAATLIEPILYQMFSHGTHATVRHWLQALPEEVLFTRPFLCLQYAWAFLYVGEIASCQRPLDVAERAWQAEGNLSRLGEVYMFQSSIAVVQGDAIRARDYAQRALPLLSEDDLINRCNYAIYTGASYLMLGNMYEASRLLNEALILCQACHLYSTLYTMNFLAEMQIVQGKLHQASATSQEVISKLAGRLSIHSSRAHSRLGRLYLEWNELDLATRHMQQAITIGEQAGQEIYISPIYLANAQVFFARGEVRAAFAVLDKAEQVALRLGRRSTFEQARALRAQLELAQGNLAQAERWGEETGIDVSDEPGYERETAYLMLVRLCIAQHRVEESVGLLGHLLAADEAAGRTGNAISVLALQAVAYWQLGNYEQAMRVLGRLLALAEPEGYVRVFVDEGAPMQALLATWLSLPAQQHGSMETSTSAEYVRKLLAAFPSLEALPAGSHKGTRRGETGTFQSPLLEPLSTREQDVLELLAVGLSNAEIAERLIVTVGTVKTHIKSIYGKLGVHSRTQAIAHARELRLL
jgi:LuxR family transcriptional regulator, maltose regulon positive regulatory protein